MLKFCSLYSGSSGNSSFIQSDNIKLLVDAGVSGKKIIDALASIHVDIQDINAILITHEHSDHTGSIATLSKKYNIPVYANLKTWDAMQDKKDKMSEKNIAYFQNNQSFTLSDLTILPFDIPHDAANPCGFSISDADSKISIATDIGHMTNSILDNLKNSNLVLLEANYEPEVLRCSSYPYRLKERIASPIGHLSNVEAGKTINYLADFGVKNVLIGHLSNENNFPELAYKSVSEQINHEDLNLNIASRFKPSQVFEFGTNSTITV